MKKIIVTTFAILFAFSLVFAQSKNIKLNINHLLDGQPYKKMKGANSPENTFMFGAETISYFVSKIKITHDGGKISEATDVYLLVNPDTSSVYDLGKMDGITNVEAIEFGLGVDKDKNHLDPTTYPLGHPLSLQNPSTHWSWTAGYRFIVFEGMAGATAANMANPFTIHSLGDALYKTVNLAAKGKTEGNSTTISVNAEYRTLMQSISASVGLDSKGGTGASKTLMENLKNAFSSAVSVGVKDLDLVQMQIFPNPVQNELTIQVKNDNNATQTITIFDITGKTVATFEKNTETMRFPINLNNGFYTLVVRENNKLLNRSKILVQQ